MIEILRCAQDDIEHVTGGIGAALRAAPPLLLRMVQWLQKKDPKVLFILFD
jgi:hypothetical protein